MAKKKLYTVSMGYSMIGCGTLSQCQAAQRALEALTPCTDRYLETPDDPYRKVLVTLENEEGCTVETACKIVLTKEEFEREKTPKITQQPLGTELI